jgi:hypothetical protein
MPKSRRRKISNYQRIQARNRKEAVNLVNHSFVLGVYERALPERQEYPPETRRERKRMRRAPAVKGRSVERLIEIPRGGLRDGTKVRTLDGVTYTSVGGGLVRARQTTLKKRAA